MDETTRARLESRGLPATCPVVTAPNGDLVFQNKHYPWTLPAADKTPVFSRRYGLGAGLFEHWTQHELVEFLDDYLDCKDICTLAQTTKEWHFFASSEKYGKLRLEKLAEGLHQQNIVRCPIFDHLTNTDLQCDLLSATGFGEGLRDAWLKETCPTSSRGSCL